MFLSYKCGQCGRVVTGDAVCPWCLEDSRSSRKAEAEFKRGETDREQKDRLVRELAIWRTRAKVFLFLVPLGFFVGLAFAAGILTATFQSPWLFAGVLAIALFISGLPALLFAKLAKRLNDGLWEKFGMELFD